MVFKAKNNLFYKVLIIYLIFFLNDHIVLNYQFNHCYYLSIIKLNFYYLNKH